MTDAFWSVYGKQIALDVESTLKSKHRLRFPFADSYLTVKNSGRGVKQRAEGSSAWKHRSSPEDISQHTEILLYAFLFQQYEVWLQSYLGGSGDPYPR